MPITLIRSNKDNVVHGTDNERTTGCRIRLQGMNCTREGEMKDIVDLTCDRCKEVFATKLIRESNREDARMAKEEKKRFLRAKKQGIVSESTYEEYVLNRESEASSKRASYEAKNNGEANAPINNNYQSYQNYQNYQSPQEQTTQPSYQAPQQSVYQQPAQPQQPVQPAATITPPPVQPVVKSAFTFPQEQINPDIKLSYAPSYESYINGINGSTPQSPAENVQESAPVYQSPVTETVQEVVPQYTQYQPQNYMNQEPTESKAGTVATKSSDDDFLSQFMVKKEDVAPVVEQTNNVQNTATAGDILSAANDILAQFNNSISDIEEKKEEVQQQANAFMGDASSFYSNQIPLVDVSTSGSKSISDINNEGFSNEFGTLSIPETPSTPSIDTIGSYASTPSVFDELVSDDVTPSVSSFESVSVLEPTVNGFQTVTPPSAQNIGSGFDTITPPPVQSMQSGFDTITPPVQPMQSGFDTITPPVQSMQSGFDTITPPVQPVQNGFDTITPPVQPMQNGFDTITPPVQPMQSGFDTITPPVQPMQNGYGTVTPPVQPMQNGYGTVTPPVQPVQNGYGTVTPPVQPVQNGYGTVTPQSAQPMQNGFINTVKPQVQPQSFVNPVQQQNSFATAPSNNSVKPVSIFNSAQHGTIDSIEEALRQLGAEGIKTPEEVAKAEKEEIIPDFIAYVPSSSKALYSKPPVNDLTSTSSKRVLSAREAKKLAKIDAKFYKDLKDRGFTPAEMRSQRRGK